MTLPGDAELDELIAGVIEALCARDRDQALYLLVRSVAGDPMAGEIAVHSRESRQVVGYLVPARLRASLRTAQDQADLAADGYDQDATLAGLLARSADSAD